jgi:hypothetical protein
MVAMLNSTCVNMLTKYENACKDLVNITTNSILYVECVKQKIS